MKSFKPYKYVKDESYNPIYSPISRKFILRVRGYPMLFIVLGIFVFASQIVLPLVYFKTKSQQDITSPVSSSVLGIASGYRDFEFEELNTGLGETVVNETTNLPDFFYLTIPKLGIEKALVETNSPTLSPDEALGHYTGSSLPGEVGNVFIYGHSVLPFFYNPKNYKTIFSTLDELQTGDEFTISYNNKDYVYIVESKVEELPEDVNPLAELKPRYLNESTAVLMTCSPPGTKLRRLMINASMVKTL